jgi:hypothetical protein
MYFKVSDFMAANPFCDIIPYRLLDPATGNVIGGVTEFDDDEGWFRVLCRTDDPSRNRLVGYCSANTNDLVSQILTVPFQVVPWFNGIDDLPVVYLDTIQCNSGHPIGSWLPAHQPYQSSSRRTAS